MIWRPNETFREFEDRLAASGQADVSRNLRMADAMYEHAVRLGAFPPKDPWEGFDVKVRMVKVLNGVPRDSGEDGRGPG